MTRIVSPGPLALGTLMHSTLGIWLDMHKRYQETGEGQFRLPSGGLANLFLQYAEQAIAKARATYEMQVGAVMSEGELAPLYESVQMGHAMMNNYQARWGYPVPDGFDIISTEMRVEVDIPGTAHKDEWVWEYAADMDGLTELVEDTGFSAPRVLTVPGTGWLVHKEYADVRYHRLGGKLDGVLRERRTGRLFVMEHKSYGQRPREDVLFTQDQFLGYHWILLQLAEGMGLQASDVAGVAYDGLWKRATVPKVVDGHKGSLEDLFCRRLITRPVQELIEYEEELALDVLEMAGNPRITKNRTADGSCFWGCSDNNLCLAMSRGEDYQYILRSNYTRKGEDDDMPSAVPTEV